MIRSQPLFRNHFIAITTASMMILATVLNPAQAQPALPTGVATSTGTQPDAKIQSLLDRYPGSVVVSADTIRLAPGVLLTLPTASTVIGPQAYSCAYEWVCLYSEANGEGYKLSFYYCGFEDLGRWDFPSGGKWNDKTTSIYNHQTDGTYSIFYNWNGVNAWDQLFGLTAPRTRNLVGTSNNDKIDGIHVC
ncbi:MAG TPA: hypothetical protein VFC19_03985 [Candidatus Limnocylindrales bacterium]|nr:hypothetical protein [Candidatus Limnocylindrales bacterium]